MHPEANSEQLEENILTHSEDFVSEFIKSQRPMNILLTHDDRTIDVKYDGVSFSTECLHPSNTMSFRHYDQGGHTEQNQKYSTPPIFMYLHSQLNVTHVLEELDVLLQNETLPLTCPHVDQMMDQVDTLLEEDSDIEIPGDLLLNLEKLVSRLELEEQTGEMVRNNFAMLLADVAPGMGVRGVRLAAGDDIFTTEKFQFVNESTQFLSPNDTVAIALLPESIVQSHRRVSFVAFRTENAFRQDRTSELNSRVFGISVENFTGFEGQEMVEIYLSPLKRNIERNQSRVCAYWHFDQNGTGHWSQEGCTLTISKEGGLDVCRCDHLTHFAEILIFRSVFSELNETILGLISVVGCCLSIFGIISIAVTAAVFKAWRANESNKVWLHLCSAVFLLNVCFLVTSYVEIDQADIWCTVTGVALHYSVLTTYCWMLVVSILSYRKLVLVFTNDYPYKLLLSSIFAWGFPILVIGILLAVNLLAYSGRFEEKTPSGHFCFPKGVSLFVTLWGPIGAMWFVNWCLYGIILRSMLEARRTNLRRHSNSKGNLRPASVSFLLAFICGIPWIFGFFAYNIIAAYIFTVTVSFQGFVLFLFFILGNKRTRDLWNDLFCSKRRGEGYSVTSSGLTHRSTQRNIVRYRTDTSSIPLRDSQYYS